MSEQVYSTPNITNSQINAYKSNDTYIITFIYGRQFTFINNCLKEKNFHDIESLLNYLTNNFYKTKIKDFNYKDVNIENNTKELDLYDYTHVINNCNDFFKEVLKLNNKSIKDIYKQNIINKKHNFNGLYYYFISPKPEKLSGYYVHPRLYVEYCKYMNIVYPASKMIDCYDFNLDKSFINLTRKQKEIISKIFLKFRKAVTRLKSHRGDIYPRTNIFQALILKTASVFILDKI